MTTPLFTLGAAMPVSQLETHRDWLIEHQRDLELQDPIRPEVLDGDWRSIARQTRSLLSGHTGRLGIHGPFDGLALMSFDPKVSQLARERLMQGLDFAEEVGATHMVVHSPWINLGQAFVPHSPYYQRENLIARVHDAIGSVVKRAEHIRCALVIENIFDTHPTPWLDLVKSFQSGYVRASIDIGHAYIMHQQAGGAPPDEWVRQASSLLEHVHLQDTDGLSDRHWRPGYGNLNWHALFDALSGLAKQPRLILELHDPRELRAGAQWLASQQLAA